MLLNDIKIKSVKPTAKSKTYPDGQRLRLLVHPNGSKYWQFRYTFESKEKTMALGIYPKREIKEEGDDVEFDEDYVESSYSHKRRHSTLGNISPVEYEARQQNISN